MNDIDLFEEKYNLPKGMLTSIASVETGGEKDPDRAISKAGAIGRFQLMPKTAKGLGVNPYKPKENMEGAAKYLRYLLDITGDEEKAVTSYNYGIGNLRKAEHNASLTGRDYREFIDAKESREYFPKYAQVKGIQGVQEIEVEQSILPNLKKPLNTRTLITGPVKMNHIKA